MKRSLTILLSLLICMAARAQRFQYYYIGEKEYSRFNPAAAVYDGSRAYALAGYNFVNNPTYKENPLDISAGASVQGDWGGIVAELSYDGYSYFSRHNINLNYTRGWKTGSNGLLSGSIGISLPVDYIHWDDIATAVIAGTGTYCSPDLCLGFEYSNEHMRTGIGMMNLIGTAVCIDGVKYTRNPRNITAHFQYRFDFKGNLWGLTPMILAGWFEKITMDFGLRVDWNRAYSLSYNIRLIDLAHIFNFNADIPGTPIGLTATYALRMLQNSQYVSGGLYVKF